MSIMTSTFGRRSNIFFDIWDRLDDLDRDAAFSNAQIDWKETSGAHVIKADLPGLKKEEMKVVVEDGKFLQISGERIRESQEKNDKWHRVERSLGKFLRRFQLPKNAKVDEVNEGFYGEWGAYCHRSKERSGRRARGQAH